MSDINSVLHIKCRRCGTVEGRWPTKDMYNTLVSIIGNMMKNITTLKEHSIHFCGDGGFGITDIMGSGVEGSQMLTQENAQNTNEKVPEKELENGQENNQYTVQENILLSTVFHEKEHKEINQETTQETNKETNQKPLSTKVDINEQKQAKKRLKS